MNEPAEETKSSEERIRDYNSFVMATWKRNLLVHVLDGVFYAMGLALAQADTIQPAFVSDAMDLVPSLAPYKYRIVGLLPLVAAASFMLPQLLSARLAESRRLLKRPLLLFAFLERLPWLFMGIATAFLGKTHPQAAVIVFLGLLVIYHSSIGVVYPVWQEMVAKTIPVRRRGLLFGLREGTGGLVGFVVLLCLSPFVAKLEYPANYGMLFCATFVCFILSYVPLFFLKEAPSPIERNIRPMREHVGALWRIVKSDGSLQRFLACRSVYGLVLVAPPAFFALRAVEVLGAETTTAEPGLKLAVLKLAMVTMLARSVVSFIVGPLGDRFGYRVVMALAALASACGIAAALAATGITGFYVAYTFTTFAHMSFWLGHGNYSLELAPHEKRPSYISLDNMSGLPFMAMPLVGGFLADKFGYGAPFVAGIVFSLVAAVLFMTLVVDPRKRMRNDLVA